MDEKEKMAAPTGENTDEVRDKELFEAIERKKKKKKLRGIIITAAIVVLVGVGIVLAVRAGRKKVRENFVSYDTEIQSFTVGEGSVSSTVSGYGTLSYANTEKLTAPEGVEILEILSTVGDRVTKGQLLARVDTASVKSLLSATQGELNKLDESLRAASYETVPANITAAANGRVKAVYAAAGDDVAACMAKNGALAILSLDGLMTCSVPAGEAQVNDAVTVILSDGRELPGTVESVIDGTAGVTLTDDGTPLGDTVEVRTAEGITLGTGELAIHSALRITGYAGTVAAVYAAENKTVWGGNNLFTLRDTAYSANYEAILADRNEKEQTLLQLLAMYRSGGVEAPYDGVIESISYTVKTDSLEDEDPFAQQQNVVENGKIKLLTIAPEDTISVTVPVDETDILSLEVGQSAQVTVNSLGGALYYGTVSEVHRNAVMNDYGYVTYEAIITMGKDPAMLAGMSANVVIRTDGSEDTLLIPERALQQSRDTAYVYTTCDEAAHTLGGEKPVTTGISNNGYVEILDGLSAGDTVYYEVSIYDWEFYAASDGNAWVSDGNAWVEGTEEVYYDAPAEDAPAPVPAIAVTEAVAEG